MVFLIDKLKKLFILHTPFQLLVSQSILKDSDTSNYLLIIKRNEISQLKETIDLILIQDLWKEIYFIDNIENGIINIKYLFDNSRLSILQEFYRDILKIDKTCAADLIFLGDPGHNVYQNIQFLLKRKSICFIEEGNSSYLMNNFKYNSIRKNLKILYFSMNQLSFSFFFNLFILARPKYYYSLDVRGGIKFDLQLDKSEKLKYYLESFSFSGSSCIYISSSMTNSIVDYELILRNIFTKLFYQYDKKILIKFHPVESDDSKSILISVLDFLKLDYAILSECYSLPVEFLIEKIMPDEIIAIDSSTVMLYSPKLFNSIPAKLIFEDFHRELQNKDRINDFQRIWYDETITILRNIKCLS